MFHCAFHLSSIDPDLSKVEGKLREFAVHQERPYFGLLNLPICLSVLLLQTSHYLNLCLVGSCSLQSKSSTRIAS